jgi:hypothetical protein
MIVSNGKNSKLRGWKDGEVREIDGSDTDIFKLI